MYQQVTTWWTILRICIEERLVYRGDFALGTLMRFLPIITQIFLWKAIYDSLPMSENGGPKMIGMLTYENMVAYYLLTMISRAFSSMPGLASGIAAQIRSGEIKKFLIQPIDLLGFLFINRVAHKLVYYFIALLPFAFVFYLCRGFFTGWPEPHILLAYFASLIMGLMLGFFLEAAIGMIGFWFLEVSSLLFVYMLFSFFLSGHMFPIDVLPENYAMIFKLIPLQYLAYFPAAIFLGKIPPNELWQGLLIEAAWVLFFMILCRFAYSRGVKRYSGFGG